MGLEIGSQPVPGHRLTRPLGQGAFGEVWEAERCDGELLALKFLDTRTRSATMISSEVRVLRALAELDHPNIVRLHGVHASSKYLILIMERADGNLSDLRAAYQEETEGFVPADHALDLLDQAAEALDFLADLKLPGFTSARGLQHCDVKPTNLLLLGNDLKVGDFGLCAGTGWQTHLGGGWRGTPPYAAPELFNGNPARGTDQFALAVTFTAMVLGERPFWKAAPAGAAPSGVPIDFTKLRDREFPVLARALHPYPSSRWPSCRAFVQELRKAVAAPRTARSVRIYPRGTRGPLRPCGI